MRPGSAILRWCCSTAMGSTCLGFRTATQSIKYSVRERYLWELHDAYADGHRALPTQPAQVRAELHDRITAPLYPLAFVVLTYAYLGAPRTTRQSRTMSLLGATSAVAALRGLGFVGTIAGVHTPIALLLPYLALIAAFVLGYFAISRGVIIEPPVFIANAIDPRHGARHAAHERADGSNVMIAGTLSRYFGLRFLSAVLAVFAGTLVLTAMIDFSNVAAHLRTSRTSRAWLIAKISLVPRAVHHRAGDAVRRAGRRDVLLSELVAPAWSSWSRGRRASRPGNSSHRRSLIALLHRHLS